MEKTKTIHIQYYALLREQRGLSQETIKTNALTAHELYQEINKKYQFKLPEKLLKVAINNEFSGWHTKLNTDDTVVFLPPVAGG